MDPIIIIGTGLAGYSAAREFRKHDKQTPVMLITRNDGSSYYKPDISEALTQGKKPNELVQKSAREMGDMLDATIRPHEQVEAIHPQARQVELSSQTLTYSRLVLAWGAEPVTLGLGGDAAEQIHKINHLLDYQSFRQNLRAGQRVAILGAGLIGCEFANDLIKNGHKVSVADPAGWPLAQFLPQKAGQVLKTALGQAGVDWHIGHAATAIQEGGNGRYALQLDNGSHITADIILSAVGLRAHTALAEDAGLKVDRGIVVDRTLATSDPNIFALGDCAEVDGLWRPFVGPLMQCARALGKTLAAAPDDAPQAVKYPALPIIVKTPSCPVIVYPPIDKQGQWQLAVNGQSVEGRFEDQNGHLRGFLLMGEATQKRRDYLKEAPPIMA